MELSKKYWTIKRDHFTPKVTWRIKRKCTPFNTTKRKCYLCLNEKLEITSYKGYNLSNKKLELTNKCRHQNRFTFLRHGSKDLKLRFHWNTSRSIPIWAQVLHNFLNNKAFKTNIQQHEMMVSLGNILGYISNEDDTEMTSPKSIKL